MATLTGVAEKTALSYVEVRRYTELTQAAKENITALKKCSAYGAIARRGWFEFYVR
ncbi:hypothetical protein [Citrobacter freundii]|uniref:Uncharacterized protein n=1 Tax=Citrobacter freundii TaxID=546 RepID=A0A7G2IXP5_CITFR|nr:hypothetical protein [Citrobacter freundii]